MIQWLKKNTEFLTVTFLSLIFCLIYAHFYWTLIPSRYGADNWVFNTPDEMANNFFISSLAKTGSLILKVPLNQVVSNDLVAPRSTVIINNDIFPGSFLGFVLIGAVIAKFSTFLYIFLTPLLSLFAAICFFYLIKTIFDRRIAIISLLLLLSLPAYWYYNSRSMFHNVVFVDFLIIGFFLFSSKLNDVFRLTLSGFFIGLALSVRTSEALWVLLVLLFLAISCRLNLKKYLFFILAFIAAFLPVFYYQNQLFGNPLAFSYIAKNNLIFFQKLIKVFLPFGFEPINIIKTVYYYFIEMFWWLAAPIVAGLIYYWKNWGSLKGVEKKYLKVSIFVSLFLIFYYGSWFFFDNVERRVSVGSSQLRYFLPLYILMLPIAAVALNLLISIKQKNIRYFLIILCIILFSFMPIKRLYFDGNENLMAVKKNVVNYYQVKNKVLSITESNAVIIARYEDKVFFPDRQVIVYWQENINTIKELVSINPVYFYSLNNSEAEYFKNAGLNLTEVSKFGNRIFYRVNLY